MLVLKYSLSQPPLKRRFIIYANLKLETVVGHNIVIVLNNVVLSRAKIQSTVLHHLFSHKQIGKTLFEIPVSSIEMHVFYPSEEWE